MLGEIAAPRDVSVIGEETLVECTAGGAGKLDFEAGQN